MTIKLKKFPKSACYLNGGSDGGCLEFTLLADGEEDDEEDDDAESAADDEEDDESGDGESTESDDDEDDGDEADDDDGEMSRKGTFQMLVHTGKVVTRWWGNLVLDMDGAKYRQRLALLKDHMTSQPLGFSTKIERTQRGIEASGKLLSNDQAREVASYSRQGYPWQASMMAVPTKVERIEAGATSTVNGREVLGPCHVFREWEMHELTLTTLGADDNTVTEAFAADGEIEVQIMTKKKSSAPASGNRAATEPLSPQAGDPPVATLSDGAAQERERSTTILRTADPSQQQLASELVENGTPLTEALQALATDMKERLQVAQQGLSVAAEPLGSGNSGGADGAHGAGGALSLEQLQSELPDDAAERMQAMEGLAPALSQEWDTNTQLRQEFGNRKGAMLAYVQYGHRAVSFVDESKLKVKLSGSLKGLGHRNVIGNYYQSYNDQLGKLWHPNITTEFTTDQDHEIFKWLGTVANPTKFEGERKRTSLTDYGLTMVTEQFDLTVSAATNELRRDKTGQFMKRIREMGPKMASLKQRLVSQLLEANGVAYDGQPLYSASHEVRKSGVQSNDIVHSTGGNPDEPTSEEFSKVMLAGVKELVGFKDEHGDPANEGANDFLVIGPTKYMNVAAAALKNEYTSAGVSNTIKSSDFSLRWATNARFNGANAAAGRRIYMFRMDAELKAILMLIESIPDAFQGNYDFMKDMLDWSGKEILTAAPGRFELTNRITLAA